MKWIGCRLSMIMVATLLFLSSSPVGAQPDKMVLDSSKASGKKQRPVVTFAHNRHVEVGLSCKDCHHVYENGENVLDETKLEEGNEDIHCFACHGPKTRRHLKQAFHDQCIGCHTKYQKEKKNTGPRYCGGCHIKK